MFQYIKRLFANSQLLQVTSFNSVNISVKLITSFVVSKLIAVLLGPSGLTYLGNLRNILSILHNFCTGGLGKAVVKYTNESYKDKEEFHQFISTLFWLFVFLSVLFFSLVFFFSASLSMYVFDTDSYQYVFQWTAALLPIYAAHVFLIAILNGMQYYNKIISINLVTHLLNLLVFGMSIYFFNLSGAFMAVVIVPSASIIFTFLLANKRFNFFRFTYFSKQYVQNFGQYALMTLVSSVSFPLVYLGLRQYIKQHIGVEEAGYWEANFRLSTFYLVFVQSLLNLYILPKLVQAKTTEAFRAIVFSFYKQIMPLFVIGLFVIFLFKKYVVLLVFSEEFLPVTTLIKWQIVADFFRIAALVMAYQFHAKKMVWHYIITDFILALLLYFMAIFFVQYFSLEGVVIGHATSYVIYFLIIFGLFRKPILNLKN